MGFGGKGAGGKPEVKAKGKVFTMKEVAQHCVPEDAWIVINNQVYDVSNWGDHPGGVLIYSLAGCDATGSFMSFHPPSASDMLEKFLVGTVEDPVSEIDRDYRAMKATIRKQDLHKPSALYYVFKCSSNLAILAAAVYLAVNFSSWSAHCFSAFLVALFWQQCGWLSHDFLHHQVFTNRHLNDAVGYFFGNIMQGFSVAWWKNKHNTHHAVPNVHGSILGRHNGDPDIDTAPVLAWSKKMGELALASGGLGKFMVKHQTIMYFPVLFFARVSWLLQSALHVMGKAGHPWGEGYTPDVVRNPKVEAVTLSLYYLWYIALMCTMPVSHALVFLFLSQTLCGLMLAIAFGVGHNGMKVYEFDARPDFFTLQVTTTRNVNNNLLVGWFMGGLHYQVEHHLFPYVPRHQLGKVQALVKPFCEKHGIRYHSTNLWVGTKEVLQHLGQVTEDLMRDFPAM